MTAETDTALVVSAQRSEDEKKTLSKRQKRKKVNEKNKWPQHPKIQDMQVRSQAYIRVAGLGSSTKKKEDIDPKLDLLSPEVKFGRLLASTDQRKRHLAVQKLKSYLKARCDISNENGGISEMDLLKLWKGLWYTLYMADKVPVQDELSKHLAELLWCVAGTEEEDEYAGQMYMTICEEEDNEGDEDEEDDDDPEVTLEEVENTMDTGDDDSDDRDDEDDDESGDDDDDDEEHEDDITMDDIQTKIHDGEDEEDVVDNSLVPHCRGAHLVSLFIRTFFRTVRREWGRMDKYRVDKFYTLARMYIHEIYLYMAKRHWNIGIIRLFNDAMFEEVLSQKPNGLRYHLIDVVLDELAKVNAKAPMPLTEATFLDAMEPYLAMCQTGAGGDDSVQRRVMENILEKFLNKYSFISEADSDESKALLFDEVHVGTVANFVFELATDHETKDQYRKSLYDMHKAFMRRLKTVGKDVALEQEEMDSHIDVEDDEENSDANAGEDVTLDDQDDSDEGNEDDLPPPPQKKEKKKKKRKKHQQAEAPIEKEADTLSTPPKKKSKKNKQPSKSDNSLAVDEEVVTITVGEQKKAKALEKESHKAQKMKKPPSTAENSDAGGKGSKRVKWLPNNKSKSYTASMKGLATATPPKTSEVTPEKGILLNKGTPRRAGVSKAGRKKAVNYF
jgi:Nucleolar protein,Nop52